MYNKCGMKKGNKKKRKVKKEIIFHFFIFCHSNIKFPLQVMKTERILTVG